MKDFIASIFETAGCEVKETKAFDDHKDSIGLDIIKDDKINHLFLHISAVTNDSEKFWGDNARKIIILAYNNIFPPGDRKLFKKDILDFIDNNFPSSPEVKIDIMLRKLYEMTKFEGDELTFGTPGTVTKEACFPFFLENGKQLEFYLNALTGLGFLELKNLIGEYSVTLTAKGIKEVIDRNRAVNSKYCFIAMAFDRDLTDVYTAAIMPALKATDFIPLRIDETNIASDVTINDAMLAAIKKSKFLIADFTRHKHGVYFEAGYALGRGLKVIYTCHENDIDKAHFDTRSYQHIVWKDFEDLKTKLINKIEAFIID